MRSNTFIAPIINPIPQYAPNDKCVMKVSNGHARYTPPLNIASATSRLMARIFNFRIVS